MNKLNINLEKQEFERIMFLAKKILNSREDIAEAGVFVLTSLRRENGIQQ